MALRVKKGKDSSRMSPTTLSRRDRLLMLVSTYAVLVTTVILGVTRAPTDTVRWISAVLSLVFGLVMAVMPSPASPTWRAHLYLAVQTSLGAILMVVHEDWTVFALLYFILSAQAMTLLPPRLGTAWIAGLVLLCGGFGFYRWGSGGLLVTLLYGGGFALFGVFAHAVVRAEAAHNQSQALLAELQKAHGQLQEYAIHAEELAVVEERNRLAREMHDTLGHRLTVASVQLEGAQRLIPQNSEQAAHLVETVRGQVREALSELRSTVATLRTPVEADLHLRSSLKRLVVHFEEATALTVHQALPDRIPDLPADHRLTLYRMAQEALTNIQKHAGASQVWLVLTAHGRLITLLVSDDGRGTSISGDQPGFGLRGLRERAAQLGGSLHLEPRRGGGTQLSLRLPLPEETGNQMQEADDS
jgi:signal transduction histidine kinase